MKTEKLAGKEPGKNVPGEKVASKVNESGTRVRKLWRWKWLNEASKGHGQVGEELEHCSKASGTHHRLFSSLHYRKFTPAAMWRGTHGKTVCQIKVVKTNWGNVIMRASNDGSQGGHW